MECVKHDIQNIIKEIGNIDKNETEKKDEIEYYDEIIKIVESIFTSEYIKFR